MRHSGKKTPRTTDFPQTLQEAIKHFSNPDVCLAFVADLRWPHGVTCPRCGHKETSFISTRRLWKCKGCKKQFSVKVGTIFEDSPLGLDKWLAAIWMIANDKNGISSYEIHRALDITQKSAWFMLHRIRLAMQTGTFQKLSGDVEVDETYIGGKARNMHKDKREAKIKGGGTVGKIAVMGLLERRGKVRTKVIDHADQETLHGEVKSHVRKGTRIYTDEWKGYSGLDAEYIHNVINHAEAYVRGNVHTCGIDNYWSLLKRSIKGTYVSVEAFHLFRYLDEQAFRFNERIGNDADRFKETVRSIVGKRLTYEKLTGNFTDQ